MRRLVFAGLLGLILLGPGHALAQSCCKCTGTCTNTACTTATSIKDCIDQCGKQGPKCITSSYLAGSTCAKDCRRRVRPTKAGGK